MRKRVFEYVRRDVFGSRAIAGAAADKGVDAIDVPVIELGEPGWISLGRLNEMPFIVWARGHVCLECDYLIE